MTEPTGAQDDATQPAGENPLGEKHRADLARAKRRARLVGLYLPLVVVAAATAVTLAWIPRLPDPAATHWGLEGGPDGFASPWIYLWLSAGLGFGLALMMWAMFEFGGRGGAMPLWSPFQRLLAAFNAGFSVFLVTVTIGSMAVQLDLEDASDAGGVGGIVSLAFAAWIAVTVAAWFAQPRVEVSANAANPTQALAVSDTERAVWFGQIHPSRIFFAVIGTTVALLLGVPILLFLMTVDSPVRWIMLGVLLIIAGLAITTMWFHVRIDADGLEARSTLGWPVIRLPAGDIERVEVTRIVPLAEFGGWGLRWGPGRFGIIMRAGEGLVATRRDGRIFAITIDDAPTAAALLTASAERARQAH